MTPGNVDWEVKRRDALILAELSRDPQRSARDLTEVLEEEYDIDVSHVTVSQSIRKMREAGVFREAIIPNEEYFSFALFEFKFNPENFAEEWRPAMEDIRDAENTLLYCLADGEYQWKTIMMFEDMEEETRWVHEFYKEHGGVVENVRISTLTNVLKFGTEPGLFQRLTSDG
jgi:DNA-binding Lrp family transcriptional regulator